MTRFTLSALSIIASLPAVFAVQKPDVRVQIPEQWTVVDTVTRQLPSSDGWWRQFNDPVLDSLISMGEDANFDLITASRRMDAAARQVDIARSSYFPAIGVNASYARARQSGVDANTWGLQGQMSWEIDLFGKIRSQVQQSRSGYRASRAEWVGAMVSMASQIASTYVQLRLSEAQLQVAIEHSLAQDSISQLVLERYKCGLGAQPQVDQSMAITQSTRATIPALRSAVVQTRAALALLVGRYPEEIAGLLDSSKGLPPYLHKVNTGVPAELLRRRPDIVAAEQNLAAAASAVGIAKKEFLPTLSLNGTVGVSADTPREMFTKNAFGYTVAPTLSWTLFDGMARRAGVAAARDKMEAQIANYNYTVMNAYNEVNTAVNAYTENIAAIADYDAAVAHAESFLDLELDLYTQGLAPYSDVATAEQTLLSYTNSALSARGNALATLISLYRALGGGFNIEY